MSRYTHRDALIRAYTSGILRAREAYNADQRTPEDRAAARAEYERTRHQKRKAGKT